MLLDCKSTLWLGSSLICLVFSSGCARSNSPALLENEVQNKSDCPVYESRGWQAWIDGQGKSEGVGLLNISGQIELPSPGYTFEYSRGPLDRRMPPSLIINLIALPPQDAVIQIISTEDVSFGIETEILQYRSIQVYCGDRQLTKIVDVVPAE